MYDIVSSIVNAPAGADPAVVAVCGVLVAVITVVIIDIVFDIFAGFFRG